MLIFYLFVVPRSYDARSYDLKRVGSKARPLKQALTLKQAGVLLTFGMPTLILT